MVESVKWRPSGSEMSGAVKNSDQPKAQQAQWNVRVVRGKVTTRCLWNACKALSIGLLLLTIGTTMAVIGYYADQLSIRSETRGNSTVKIKNESRGFHLNNLSYAGPIVMGIGGFIVVAACVMTFEARDSAAKVVPARFKPNLNASIAGESTKATPRTARSFQKVESKRSAGVQTPAGGKCPRKYRLESTGMESDWSPQNDPIGRRAFTAAFVQLSRELMENSSLEGHRRWRRKVSEANLNKSPSAPDLAVENSEPQNADCAPIACRRLWKGSPNSTSRAHRESVRPLATVSSNILLRPSYLQRQALSVDNPFYDGCECYTPPSMSLSRQHSGRSGGSRESMEMELGSSAGVSGSQTSMALDLHDCQVTLKVKDESANKRSDTSRRHQLLRQKPVEDDVTSRCSCASRFLCSPMTEEGGLRAKSSVNLKSPCHHCLRATRSCSGRGHTPKMTADYRSQSFSPTCSFNDPKRCFLHESSKIFCIDDHGKANLSSENIRVCCCEKFRHLRRHSPCASPNRSPRVERREQGSECLVHRGKDSGSCAVAVHNAKKRKGNKKMEGSLSAEESHFGGARKAGQSRSSSFSPTPKSPSGEGSSSPGKQSWCSVVEVSRASAAGKAEEEEKRESFEVAEPS